MEATARPRVKICCISSVEEAQISIRHGASGLGLVSTMPSGPGVIEESLIRQIASLVPPGVSSFLLTALQDARAVTDQQRRCGTNTIQLVDQMDVDSYQIMREALPGIGLVQVVHVTGWDSVEEAISIAPYVDAVLLDSGNPSLSVKELGGTGRRHDWSISRRIREKLDVPVFLAGGLKPENVREAIEIVGPFGLDVCSGVRTHGRLDEAKLACLFEQLS